MFRSPFQDGYPYGRGLHRCHGDQRNFAFRVRSIGWNQSIRWENSSERSVLQTYIYRPNTVHPFNVHLSASDPLLGWYNYCRLCICPLSPLPQHSFFLEICLSCHRVVFVRCRCSIPTGKIDQEWRETASRITIRTLVETYMPLLMFLTNVVYILHWNDPSHVYIYYSFQSSFEIRIE